MSKKHFYQSTQNAVYFSVIVLLSSTQIGWYTSHCPSYYFIIWNFISFFYLNFTVCNCFVIKSINKSLSSILEAVIIKMYQEETFVFTFFCASQALCNHAGFISRTNNNLFCWVNVQALAYSWRIQSQCFPYSMPISNIWSNGCQQISQATIPPRTETLDLLVESYLGRSLRSQLLRCVPLTAYLRG